MGIERGFSRVLHFDPGLAAVSAACIALLRAFRALLP